MPLRRSISKCISRVGLTVALLLAAFRVSAVTSYKQPGFSETVLFSGLTNPTVVRFLPDGRVLVAEKSGLIKIFPNLTTNTYTVVADLRTPVHNFWDRGLLGLAVDPNFTTNNYIYVLYAYDAVIGGTPPKWGTAGQTSDPCPGPTSTPPGPGATTDGCVISGRLSRLTATGSDWTASEMPLINDWCQQFPSHSTGALDFGADGYLYVSGGDGASFNNSDWGNYGGTVGSPPYTPANPCGDPPFPIGTPQTKPTAEGGALRSQSPRRTAGEPRLLNGSILRVDPATGAAAPGNPLIGSGDVNEQRIIGYGFRNPFRMIVRPGTNEVWIADVGWNTWEELNKIPDLATARNFGWPCWEGNAAQYTGLNICPTQAQTVAPVLTYNHGASVVAGDGCTVGSSSVAGMAFYQGASNYPSTYPNALFFSDYSRKCMWVMFPDGSGNPNPASTAAFASSAAGPVDLRIGPDGNLYYVDFDGGRIMQVKYGLAAVATANPTSGNAPLTVNFDGSGSVPAQPGDTLSYAWDLDGDGQYDDSAAQQPTWVYAAGGTYTARLKVTDQRGGSAISAPVTITAGAAPPTAIIDTPLSTLTWKVNDTIAFTGHATDPQDGTLAASQLAWTVLIQHCPSNCHSHTYQTFSGVASGSFPAPDHEYPSHLDIQLTATNSHGLTNTATVSINPQTASLNFLSAPAGLQLTVGTSPPQATPFTQTVIVGSVNSVQTASPQGTFPNVWDFGSWSDGGAQDHSITAPAGSSSYTATFATHADLSLAVTPSPEPVGAGATLTYTLTVANAGPSQANSVSLSDSLPAGTTFVSAAGSGWSCSGSGPVTCTMGSLGITAASPVTITVTAPAAAGAIVNTASVTSATGDLVAGNNSATTTSNVFARADLAVTQSGAPASICTGQPITYTLNVTNGGPSTATSVSVSDTLPAGAGFVSASGSGWSCSGTSTVTCTRASLPTGAAPAITIMITAPAAAGTATNSVSVSSATNDPAAGNNVANASTTVNAVPATPTASNNGPVCAGATLQLSTPAVSGATYSWTGPNGFTSTLQNPAIAGATLAAAGLYSVTVTTNACTSTAGTTAATVRALPTATVVGRCGNLRGRRDDDFGRADRHRSLERHVVRRRDAERRGRLAGDALRQPRGHDHVHGDRGLGRELRGQRLGQRRRHDQPAPDRRRVGLGRDLRRRGDTALGIRRRNLRVVAGGRPFQRRELLALGVALGHHDLHADGHGCERLRLQQRADGHGHRQPETDRHRVRNGGGLRGRRDDDFGRAHRRGPLERHLVRRRDAERRGRFAGDPLGQPGCHDDVHGRRRLRHALRRNVLRQRPRHGEPASDRRSRGVGCDLRRRGDSAFRVRRGDLRMGAGGRPLRRRELLALGVAFDHDDLHADGHGRERLRLEQRADGHGHHQSEADRHGVRNGGGLCRRRDDDFGRAHGRGTVERHVVRRRDAERRGRFAGDPLGQPGRHDDVHGRYSLRHALRRYVLGKRPRHRQPVAHGGGRRRGRDLRRRRHSALGLGRNDLRLDAGDRPLRRGELLALGVALGHHDLHAHRHGRERLRLEQRADRHRHRQPEADRGRVGLHRDLRGRRGRRLGRAHGRRSLERHLVRRRDAERRGRFAGDPLGQPGRHDDVHGRCGLRHALRRYVFGKRPRHREPAPDRRGRRFGRHLRGRRDAALGIRRNDLRVGAGNRPLGRGQLLALRLPLGDDHLRADRHRCERLRLQQRAGRHSHGQCDPARADGRQ